MKYVMKARAKSKSTVTLPQISQNMPNTVTDVISNVGKQVNNRGITAKDVSEYHDKLAYFHDQKSDKYFEEER